jgi:hypothetical protein
MCPVIKEDSVMAGLKWAPEMRKKAHAVTTREMPKAKEVPKIPLECGGG